MRWLERNARVLKEAQQGLNIELGKITVAYRGTAFVPAGTFVSQELGIVHAGLKYPYRYGDKDRELKHRLAEELTIIDKIDQKLPDRRLQVPSFQGLLVDNQGPIALITEDFSRGGRFEVHDRIEVPRDFENLIYDEDGIVMRSQLERMGFTVNGKVRWGDFDNLGAFARDDYSKMFDIKDEIERYTVKTEDATLRERLLD